MIFSRVVEQRIAAHEAVAQMQVDMGARGKRRQCAAVRSSQLERADPVRFRGDAGNLDDTGCIRHDGLPARPAGWDSASAVMHQRRSEEHTSELQSLMSISYAVFCLKKKKK